MSDVDVPAGWVTGGRLRVHAHRARSPLRVDTALHHAFDLSFEELLEHGLAPRVAAALPAEEVAAITRAVEQLAPLPCMCDTGCETPDQHGRAVTLLRRDHPQADVEFHVTVARCDVCASLWSFEAVGDSHYGYKHSARRVKRT